MKLRTTFFVILVFLASVQSTRANTISHFSQEETDAFLWLEKVKISSKFRCSSLSENDQEILLNGLKSDENTVKQTYLNLCTAICATLPTSDVKYQPAFVATIMNKLGDLPIDTNFQPTDVLSARWHVFKTLLTPEEKQSVWEKNYRNNPEKAYSALKKAGSLFAIELAKLGIIEDNIEAKTAAAQEYTQQRIDLLKIEYGEE